MKSIKQVALCLISLAILSACGATVIRAEGPYLQVGPADALIGEFAVPDRETCQQLLVQFTNVYKVGKCAANSANLPFAGVVRHDFQDITMPISARTLRGCQDLEKRVSQGNGWKVKDACKQVAKAADGQSAPNAKS